MSVQGPLPGLTPEGQEFLACLRFTMEALERSTYEALKEHV